MVAVFAAMAESMRYGCVKDSWSAQADLDLRTQVGDKLGQSVLDVRDLLGCMQTQIDGIEVDTVRWRGEEFKELYKQVDREKCENEHEQFDLIMVKEKVQLTWSIPSGVVSRTRYGKSPRGQYRCGAVDGKTGEQCGWHSEQFVGSLRDMKDAKLAYLKHLADVHGLMISTVGLVQGPEAVETDGITMESWYRGCTRCKGLKDDCDRCHGAVYRANCVAGWESLQTAEREGEEKLRVKALKEEQEAEECRLKALKEEQEAEECYCHCRRW